FGIGPRLLHRVGSRSVARLGFYDCNRKVAVVPEQIIHALRRLARKPSSDRNDAAIRDAPLLCYGVRAVIPSGCLELRHDMLSAGIGFIRHGPPRSLFSSDWPSGLPSGAPCALTYSRMNSRRTWAAGLS